jgi:hypothetical protein
VIGASTLAKTAVVAGAVALAVGLEPHGGAAPPARPAPFAGTRARLGLDAASDAQARQMRRATLALGAELSAAGRCASAECMVPALRRAGMGGRTNGMLVRVVMASVPAGRCRNYLYGLSAANDAAGDDARWLLPRLYESGRQHARQEIATQLGLAGHTLRHAALAAAADVCSPAAGGPRS